MLNKIRNLDTIKSNARIQVYQQPLSLFVETLVVTDDSIYNKFKTLFGTNDQNTIFEYMRIYYAHQMNGVISFNLALKSFKVVYFFF